MGPEQPLTLLPSRPESAQLPSTEPRFYLLSLPRELRDNIYEHVSASSSAHPIKVFRKESIHCYVKEDEKRTALSNKSYAGLARVCHQIRHEYLRIHRKHTHVLINYGDVEHWFHNCTVGTESAWHVRHVHISVPSPNDENFVADRQVLPLLQYRARNSATFECSFEFIEEISEDRLMSSGSYSWSDGHLTNSRSPYQRHRKNIQDANTLIAHSEEGWLACLSEDPSNFKEVMLGFRDQYLLIQMKRNTSKKLNCNVRTHLRQCFMLENNKQSHLPEARLAGPEITITFPEILHEYSLDPDMGCVRYAYSRPHLE